MTLKLIVDSAAEFSGAVLPNVPTERELVESLPGFVSFFRAADRGPTGADWLATYGTGMRFPDAPLPGTREGRPVIPFINAATFLNHLGFTGWATMPGVTFAMKYWQPNITQPTKRLIQFSTGTANPALTFSVQTETTAQYTYRNSAGSALNRTASNITGWRNMMLQKNGTGAMRSSLNGEALTDHEAPGTALNATGLSIGGSFNNGVPAIEVEKVLFLRSGVLTADQMADVARLMA